MLHVSLLVLFSSLLLMQVAYAQVPSLPECANQSWFTVCVTSYQILDDNNVVVYGTVKQDYPFTIRLLSVTGTAESLGFTIGAGEIMNLPTDLPTRTEVPLQASLHANQPIPHTFILHNSQLFHITVTAQFCIPWFFGCVVPFSYTYATDV